MNTMPERMMTNLSVECQLCGGEIPLHVDAMQPISMAAGGARLADLMVWHLARSHGLHTPSDYQPMTSVEQVGQLIRDAFNSPQGAVVTEPPR